MGLPSSSWLPISTKSPFSLAHFPFGIITKTTAQGPYFSMAIGKDTLDLSFLGPHGEFSRLPTICPHLSVFSEPTLNAFVALPSLPGKIRKYNNNPWPHDAPKFEPKNNPMLRDKSFLLFVDIKTHLPFPIGDQTNYCAREHYG